MIDGYEWEWQERRDAQRDTDTLEHPDDCLCRRCAEDTNGPIGRVPLWATLGLTWVGLLLAGLAGVA
jgi:hypothetical protein